MYINMTYDKYYYNSIISTGTFSHELVGVIKTS